MKNLIIKIINNKKYLHPDLVVKIANFALLHKDKEINRRVLYLLYCQYSYGEAHAITTANQFIICAAQRYFRGSQNDFPIGFLHTLQKKNGLLVLKSGYCNLAYGVVRLSPQELLAEQALLELKKHLPAKLKRPKVIIAKLFSDALPTSIRFLLQPKYFASTVYIDLSGIDIQYPDRNTRNQKRAWFQEKLAQKIQERQAYLTNDEQDTANRLLEQLRQVAQRLQEDPLGLAQALRDSRTPEAGYQVLLGM